jgi:acyl-coenzyme A synthetase/AMP-(fatty) acid ligase
MSDELPIALIEWGDAWASQDGHTAEALDNEHAPKRQSSVGFLYRQDKHGVMLVGCMTDDDAFDRVLFIPAGMVVSVKYLK